MTSFVRWYDVPDGRLEVLERGDAYHPYVLGSIVSGGRVVGSGMLQGTHRDVRWMGRIPKASRNVTDAILRSSLSEMLARTGREDCL